MRRSSHRLVVPTAASLVIAVCLLSSTTRGEEPKPNSPPHLGALTGDAARQVTSLEEQIRQAVEMEDFIEAAKLAAQTSKLRRLHQGKGHWETASATWKQQSFERLVQSSKAEVAAFNTLTTLVSEAEQFHQEQNFSDAMTALDKVLDVRTRVLGEDHPDTARAYNDIAVNLAASSKLGEAMAASDKALAIYGQSFGDEHPDTASAYFNRGVIYYHQDNYTDAVASCRKALKIQESVLGVDHLRSAECYELLAAMRSIQGDNEEALRLFKRALAIWQRELGDNSTLTARGLNNVAFALAQQGRYAEGQPLYHKALEVQRRLLGENHPFTANAYANAAANLDELARYDESMPFHQRALAIRRNRYGDDHSIVAESYQNLSVNYSNQGRFSDALDASRQSLEIYLGAYGEHSTFAAAGYNLVASNLQRQGRFAEAQPLYERAIGIGRMLSRYSATTATYYNNAATNLDAQGKYAEAEPLFESVLDIREKVLRPNHPSVAMGLSNASFNLMRLGETDKVAEYLSRALSIMRDAYGEEHPRTALIYNNLGSTALEQEQYREAQDYFETALKIRLATLGEEHPATAITYGNLGHSLSAQGKYVAAHDKHKKCLETYRRVLGEDHPDTAKAYNRIAKNFQLQGKYREAWQAYLSATERIDDARRQVAFSGIERTSWLAEHGRLRQMSTVGARLGMDREAWQALEQDLGRGLWDEISLAVGPVFSAAEKDELSDAEWELQQLEQLLNQKLSAAEREDAIKQSSTASVRLGELKVRLAKKHGPPGGEVYDLDAIQATLPADTAFVAWIDTPVVTFPGAVDTDGEHWAVVLRKQGRPIWIELPGTDDGRWTDEDLELAAQVRDRLHAPDAEAGWQRLADRLRQQRLAPIAAALGETTSGLPEVRHLVVLPSPHLAGIPINVLTRRDDPWTVSFAPSATIYSWLQRRKTGDSDPPSGLLAVGDPVFRQRPLDDPKPALPPHGLVVTTVVPESNAATAGIEVGDVLLAYNGNSLKSLADLRPVTSGVDSVDVPVVIWRDGDTQNTSLRPGRMGLALARESAPEYLASKYRDEQIFLTARSGNTLLAPLPATAWEVASLQRRFGATTQPAETLLGLKASEQALWERADNGRLASYRYIHLATHGRIDDLFPQRSAIVLTQVGLPDALVQVRNNRPVFDGQISVSEIAANWTLRAELVTLSACQTALGRQAAGEGYVGFTQALLLAGADSVCLSLWDVDDTATALLMDRFYANLLGKRDGLTAPLPKADALAEAQAWLREVTVAEATDRSANLSKGVSRGVGHKTNVIRSTETRPSDLDARPYDDPYYWAAFILIGRTE